MKMGIHIRVLSVCVRTCTREHYIERGKVECRGTKKREKLIVNQQNMNKLLNIGF